MREARRTLPDPVQRFRQLTGRKGGRPVRQPSVRPPVPPREIALVALLLTNVAWLTFALGGVRIWGELTALALALGGLFLLPKWRRGEIDGSPSPVVQLLRLPLFWCGLGLYGYFFIQSWNLAWDWTILTRGRPAMMSVQPLVDWLPTGIEAPFDESNPLRAMTFYTTPWLACCCAWAGLGTRRSVGWMLHGLALLGVFFAFTALRQHFLHIDRILGIFPTVPAKAKVDIPFWGTLINENHAAFYLILANGLCLGLFLGGWHRDIRLFKHRGGAWLLYLGLAFLCTFAVLMAQARGAIGFVAVQWLLFIVLCSVFFVWRFGLPGVAFPGFFAALAVAIAVTFVVNPDVYERQKEEWIRTFNLVENPELEARYYMMQISGDMIAEKPWFGHGAGSWRYLHLPHLQKYPEFRTQREAWLPKEFTGERERRTVTVWFKEAHVDLLQYLIEWGVAGCLFPLAAGAWLMWRGLRARGGWDLGAATLLMTCAVVFAGAAVEFHFRIPLVLLVWCLLFTLAIRSVELNARHV